MAKKGKRYTEQERARILSAAAKDGLTGKQAAKRFGVSEVTLWKWRRDAKGATVMRQPRGSRTSTADSSLDGLLRSQVRDRIQQLLPELVREEVGSYVAQVLGSKRRM